MPRTFRERLLGSAPSQPIWPIAMVVGVATAVPVIVATLLGIPALGLQATLGAFIVVHATDQPLAVRVRKLPLFGLGLILAAAIGALLAKSSALTVLGFVVIGAIASTLVVGYSVAPPGPMFFVLVYGTAAAVAAPLSAHGAGAERYIVVAATAAGALFSYILVVIPYLVRRTAFPMSSNDARFRWGMTPTQRDITVRMIVSLVISAILAIPCGPQNAALIAFTALAIPVPGMTRRLALNRSLARVIGTLVGSLFFVIISPLHLQGVPLGLVLGLLQCLVQLLIARNYAIALIFVAPLSLLIQTAIPGVQPIDSALGWIFDTAVGSAVALLSLVVVRMPRDVASTERSAS